MTGLARHDGLGAGRGWHDRSAQPDSGSNVITEALPLRDPAFRAARPPARRAGHQRYGRQRVALVDVLDRVLATGVVVVGDVTLSIADIDLVTISLRALLCSAGGLLPAPGDSTSEHRAAEYEVPQ